MVYIQHFYNGVSMVVVVFEIYANDIKKHRQKHPLLQVVVQQWIIDDLNESTNFKHNFKRSLEPYYTNIYVGLRQMVKIYLLMEKVVQFNTKIDILPKPRPEFISLMKYSIEDKSY